MTSEMSLFESVPFHARHLSVVGLTVDGDRLVQAVEHDPDHFVRIAGDDRIVCERREACPAALVLARRDSSNSCAQKTFAPLPFVVDSRRAPPGADCARRAERRQRCGRRRAEHDRFGRRGRRRGLFDHRRDLSVDAQRDDRADDDRRAPEQPCARREAARAAAIDPRNASRTTNKKSVGTMIVAISSKLIVNGPRWISGGTSASKPKSDKKYHAGYGTKNFVGSAFASRYGGNASDEEADDDEDDERERAVHEELIRPEAVRAQRAAILDDGSGRAVMAEDRQVRADEQHQDRRHQPDVQSEEAIDRRGSHAAAALRDVLHDRAEQPARGR